MKKITVVVTNDEERRRAEYVAAHWEEISYRLNGIYFEIEIGDFPAFEAGEGTENDPDYIKLYNAIFKESEDAPRPVGRPPKMDGGRPVNVYLDADSIAVATRLGKGKVSEGIRLALKQAAERERSYGGRL